MRFQWILLAIKLFFQSFIYQHSYCYYLYLSFLLLFSPFHFQTLLDRFLPIFHHYHSFFNIHWLWSFVLIFFCFFFTHFIWSIFSLSFSVYFIYFSACYKHRECSSFLSRVKVFFVYLIHYLFRYLYFAFLCNFLLVSLLNRMINKFFCKLLIKSWEDIPEIFPWWDIAFIIIKEVIRKAINISLYFWNTSYLL